MVKNLNGYMGKLLRVNLTDGSFKDFELKKSLTDNYIGGTGIGARLLYDELESGVDPLGPDNKLIFMTGPLTGIISGKFEVIAKSPLSGPYGDANSGGFWAPELKFAGYDGIIVEGKSPSPVVLTILEGQPELVDAKKTLKVWGKEIAKTESAIRKHFRDPKIKIASIGPAGEKLVLFASIMNDGRALGRCGMGAVMGSKNLKAIAVKAHGANEIKLAKPDLFEELLPAYFAACRKDMSISSLGNLGTPQTVMLSSSISDMPSKYWTHGIPEVKEIDGVAIQKINIRTPTCYSCPAHCHRWIKIGGFEGKGPEYETIAAFGSLLQNPKLEPIVKANTMCNNLGMDTISCGSVIGWAMEAFEKGILTEEDIGMDLTWGNMDSALNLVKMIADRKDFGDTLADGVKRASAKVGKGSDEFAIHVKGLEMPMHEPRALKMIGLHYATDAVGCRHSSNHHALFMELTSSGVPELGKVTKRAKPRTKSKKKAEPCKITQDYNMVIASYVVCCFLSVGKVINSNTIEDMLLIGERIFNLRRAFNFKHGATRADDTLPKRMTSEPLQEGGSKGETVPIDEMLQEYYEFRGWDPATAKPTKAKLDELGLTKVAKDLWS
ncbi:MAG: aldehyde ferredoxin oxidoreductase family protein [Candidatus Helarchaeota archaeon]